MFCSDKPKSSRFAQETYLLELWTILTLRFIVVPLIPDIVSLLSTLEQRKQDSHTASLDDSPSRPEEG